MAKNPKQIAFEDDVLRAMSRGVEKIARAVKSTLGPVGRNAVIDRGWGEPLVTKDGASVADHIDLSDPFENMAAKLLREAAERTSNEAGDGSTTATVLAEAIFQQGVKRLVGGANPILMARGIARAAEAAAGELKKLSTPVKSNAQIQHLATVAANHEKSIGKTIADAIEKVGKDGVITIEEGKEIESSTEVVEGMVFDRGYLSPHFVTHPDKMVVELTNPLIFITEEKLNQLPKVIPLLEKALKEKRSLLIIAEDVEGEVLSTFVVNKLKGVLKCAAVKAPAYGDRRKAMLQDIAILTGGTAFFKDLGVEPSAVEIRDLGTAKKVRITAEETTIVAGGGNKRDIDARAADIRRELDDTESEYDREKLQERLAKLVGGVCVISVGAATESDMKQKKSRFESALSATRAAQAEGILPGGGVALYRAHLALEKLTGEGLEEQAGIDAVREALRTPIRQLCLNSGVEPATVLRNIRKEKKTVGYDLLDEKLEHPVDMLEAGIIDATKVVRSALKNAASVASLLLTCDAMVANLPKDEDEDDHHHHHHGDDGMDF